MPKTAEQRRKHAEYMREWYQRNRAKRVPAMAIDLPGEEWRPVVGYEGCYEVSSIGRVKNLREGRGSRPNRLRTLVLNQSGYPSLHLYKNGVGVQFTVHRLVAAAFLGPCPERREVNHKSGVRTDNRVSNLEYITHAENTRHAAGLGLMSVPKGSGRRHKLLRS